LKTLVIIIVAVIVLYFVLSTLVYFFQRKMVYHPEKELLNTPEDVGLEYENIVIETSDAEHLSGWFVPHASPRALLLYLHGNAGNIGDRIESLRMFADLGFSVLIFDYRGYGASTGKPGEKGTYRDAEAAWRYVIENLNIPPQEVVILGRSLGGAIAIELATRVTPKNLILDSTFLSIRQMGRDLLPGLPIGLLSRIRYNSQRRIGQIHHPVIIMHSREDELIPFEHGRQLFELANEPKEFLELHGQHSSALVQSREVVSELVNTFVFSSKIEPPLKQ